ncbi:unnamed protein product [Musa acuminata subsp. burmannicoides]
MSIVRRNNIFDPFYLDVWDPFRGFPLDAFRSLSETRPGFVSETSAFANTRIDWNETPEAHVFKADLPGVKKEEVKVEVEEGRVLQISGERSKEEEEKSDKWHRVERSSGKFLRRFRLPENAKVDQVKASMENGVLTVTVPKEEAKKPEMNQRRSSRQSDSGTVSVFVSITYVSEAFYSKRQVGVTPSIENILLLPCSLLLLAEVTVLLHDVSFRRREDTRSPLHPTLYKYSTPTSRRRRPAAPRSVEHHLITAMSIVRRSNIFDPFSLDVWDPFQGFPFDAFRSLAETRPGFVSETSAFANTRIDWKETPEAHVFKADLPGVKKEEVKVEVEEGRVLQISGERSKEKEEKSDKWHRVERSSGKFLRRFRLPENAKVDQVKASMENGVLTVTVPKEEAQKKPRMKSIEISG